MLRSLHIRNYVLIDSLDVDFPEGLVIITGQTGAGKSILLGALSLLTGGKADSTLISEGADNCVVEADFSVDASDEELKAILEDAGAEWDGGELVIRRILPRSGRARCFVNDCPVGIQVLSDIASRIVDVHSQHQSLILGSRRFQLALLDSFAGAEAAVANCRNSWSELQSIRKELSSCRESLARLQRDAGYNEAQFRQLDEAKLRSGELAQLETEQKALANSSQIKENLGKVMELFNPSQGETPGLDRNLKEAVRSLERISAFVPGMEALSERMESARIELSDILEDVKKADAAIDTSEDRLQQVEDRMALLYDLMRKHGCSNEDELIALRDQYGGAVADSSGLEEKVRELEAAEGKASADHLAICRELHECRAAKAPELAEAILDSLRFLELESARFEVELKDSEPGADGADDIHLLFSSNRTAPVDVSKCASGGELSRIMLSLKEVMARHTGMPTMIFDEIDTGVSGSAADKMGSMICRMGDNMQIFAITHLPQVAAKGRAHYVVKKESMGDKTVSSIHRVEGEDRVMEIARLLSGSDITPEAVANARTLI